MGKIVINGDLDDDLNLKLGAYGIIHLRDEKDITTPTDLYIYEVDDGVDISGDVKLTPEDEATIDAEIDRVFAQSNMQKVNYGLLKRRSYRMDIWVPKSLIDKYKIVKKV